MVFMFCILRQNKYTKQFILIHIIYILSIYIGNLPSWMLICYCSIRKNFVVGSANNGYQMMICQKRFVPITQQSAALLGRITHSLIHNARHPSTRTYIVYIYIRAVVNQQCRTIIVNKKLYHLSQITTKTFCYESPFY